MRDLVSVSANVVVVGVVCCVVCLVGLYLFVPFVQAGVFSVTNDVAEQDGVGGELFSGLEKSQTVEMKWGDEERTLRYDAGSDMSVVTVSNGSRHITAYRE